MRRIREIYITSDCFVRMKHLALTSEKTETGGLIYGRMNPKWLKIYDVSGPGPNAIALRNGISFDMDFLEQYSNKLIKQNLFILGTWHSHPPNYSLTPSMVDKIMMEHFADIYKILYPPVFAIVGVKHGVFVHQFYEPNQDKINHIRIV